MSWLSPSARLTLLVTCLAGSISCPPTAQSEPLDQETIAALSDSLAVARTLFEQMRYYEAEPLLRRLLPRAEEAFGASSVSAVDLVDMLVGASYQTGKAHAEETLLLAQHAVSTRLEQYGLLDDGTAKSLANLGVVHAMRGNLTTADSLFAQVLRIREQLDSTTPKDLALIIGHLANVRTLRSDFTGAIPLMRRALSILEAEYGADSPRTFTTRLNLANLLTRVRDYVQARPLLDKQIELVEEAGLENEDLAASYSILAPIHHVIGDREEALRLQQRALAIREKFHSPSHPRIAETMRNVGVALSAVGRHEEGLTTIERSRELFERYHGPEHFELGDYDQDLGAVYLKLGRWEEARTTLERALRLRRLAQGDRTPKVIEVLVDLADLSMREGHYEDARSKLTQAVDVLSEDLGPDHRYVAPYLNKLARVCFQDGRFEEAIGHALKAERIFTQHVRLTTRTLPERQALLYVRQRGAALDLVLSLMDETSVEDLTSRVWDALIRSRAMVLDEIAVRNQQPGSDRDPGMTALWRSYQQASADLANLYLQEPGDLDPAEHRRRLDDAHRAMEDAQRKVVGAGGTGARLERARSTGWSEVQAALPQGASLLAFVLHQQYLPGSVLDAEPALRYRAMVLPAHEGEPVCIDLGEADRIDELIGAWREEVTLGPLRTDRDRQAGAAAYQHAAADLREIIWDPVAPFFDDAAQVFIVPDGQIHLVNLAALPHQDGSFLVESDLSFHYLTAERDLLQPRKQATQAGVLVMGAPDFERSEDPDMGSWVGHDGAPETERPRQSRFRGERPSCAGLRSMQFEPLPAALVEAREVAGLWESEGSNLAPTAAVRLLTGPSASEGAFKEFAPECAVLHIATHGYFLNGQCPSGLTGTRGIGILVPESAGGDAPTEPDLPAPVNPLLLSGLALSGANDRTSPGADMEDGILTAQEIAALDLSSVRLAVLSACETGAGEVLNGEGIFGLRRAFRIAGAGTLVTSLWSVQDQAAREWMGSFYHAIQIEGLPTIEAVRTADLQVLQGRRERGEDPHPFYWAAFVASGDWR